MSAHGNLPNTRRPGFGSRLLISHVPSGYVFGEPGMEKHGPDRLVTVELGHELTKATRCDRILDTPYY